MEKVKYHLFSEKLNYSRTLEHSLQDMFSKIFNQLSKSEEMQQLHLSSVRQYWHLKGHDGRGELAFHGH